MAKNLQAKLPAGDTISVFDINKDAAAGLKAEADKAGSGAGVEVAESAADASRDAVSLLPLFISVSNAMTMKKSGLKRKKRKTRRS